MAGKLPVSPLAPANFPDLPVIEGVTFATAQAGVKYKDRTDVMLALLTPGTTMTGVFTRSSTRSANVLDCQAKIEGDSDAGAAIIVNSGNSNAFTGRAGEGSVAAICDAVAEATGLPSERVFTSSTGVIGERLPHDRITAKVAELVENQDAGNISNAANAIMTTDTFPKGATATATLDGVEVKIAGFAKGSGMIAPDMATMLCYIFTDTAISRDVLQQCLWLDNASTFNCVTVDGDTSTSDTVLVAATGKADMEPITDFADPRVRVFRNALHAVMKDLAIQIARDGEGATKLIAVAVTGAESDAAAHTVGLAIASSPLGKTAFAGEDPNWGCIVMAVGNAVEFAERDRLTIRFGCILVAEKGWVSPGYREELGAAYMRNAGLKVSVDLGVGVGAATVWTCDLTHQYITIIADYRS